MPNGVDKNLVRLAIACAMYRREHGDWPTEASLEAGILWDIAGLVDRERFRRLASRLRLQTTPHARISVGSGAVSLDYGGAVHRAGLDVGAAWRWLGLDGESDSVHRA